MVCQRTNKVTSETKLYAIKEISLQNKRTVINAQEELLVMQHLNFNKFGMCFEYYRMQFWPLCHVDVFSS